MGVKGLKVLGSSAELKTRFPPKAEVNEKTIHNK